jgi:hypothetical protein
LCSVHAISYVLIPCFYLFASRKTVCSAWARYTNVDFWIASMLSTGNDENSQAGWEGGRGGEDFECPIE